MLFADCYYIYNTLKKFLKDIIRGYSSDFTITLHFFIPAQKQNIWVLWMYLDF